MTTLTKRQKAIAEKVEANKVYDLDAAVALLNSLPTAKFKESMDVAINLGVDPRKSDQIVRGATVLPAGTGKTVRVAVFAQGAQLKLKAQILSVWMILLKAFKRAT
jgi:large subunit ribosomal protein L1